MKYILFLCFEENKRVFYIKSRCYDAYHIQLKRLKIRLSANKEFELYST